MCDTDSVGDVADGSRTRENINDQDMEHWMAWLSDSPRLEPEELYWEYTALVPCSSLPLKLDEKLKAFSCVVAEPRYCSNTLSCRTYLPPDWGMLRRSRCIQIFL